MERPKVRTKFQEEQLTREEQDVIDQMINQCMIQSKSNQYLKKPSSDKSKCEPIDEASSPKPPQEEENKNEFTGELKLNICGPLEKDCPICLCLMTEPCRFHKNICEHRICKSCMEGMYEQAKQRIYTLDSCNYRSMSVKCPFCREYSIINLNEDKDYIQIDRQYLAALLDQYEDEFKAIECCGGDVSHAHNIEYAKYCEKYLSQNCTLTFEIGLRVNNKSQQWSQFVRIKNQKYQKIIDKIIYQVDFCLHETNIRGVKNPIVHRTNDQFFRQEKQLQIKKKQPVEIKMKPVGGGGRVFGTELPDYLPVKLYFYKIRGLNSKVRQIVHEGLKDCKNQTMEFIISANRKELDKLL